MSPLSCATVNAPLKALCQVKGPNTPLTFTIDESTNGEVTITVSTGTAGYYLLRLWIIEPTETDYNIWTRNPPSRPGRADWWVCTDSTGKYDLTLWQSSGEDSRDFKLCGVILGRIGVSETFEVD